LRLLSPILATLLLAALFAPPAQAGKNLDMPGAHAQSVPFAYPPAAITCDVPGPKARPILVPAGKNPLDFCPATAIAYYFPVVSNAAPASDWANIEMRLNKDALMQLDNLAAAKLRNKTPGQQTPEKLP
jgi:hypothetical protein